MNDFESTGGQTFEVCLDRAIYSLKKTVIKSNIAERLMFDTGSLVQIYSQIYNMEMSSQDNALKQDITQVQKIIDHINKDLMKNQKELEQKYKKRLDQEAYDKSRNSEVTEYDKADEDAIRSAMISDNILFYFSKYFKYQKYQNEVNSIIYDAEYSSQAYVQFADKLEQN
jgi:hypothetical protein